MLLKKIGFKTLKDISIKVTSGITPKSGGDSYTDSEKGIPFIRSGDFTEADEINFDELLYIKPEIHNGRMKKSHVKKGDLLFAIVGATIGKVAKYDYDFEANINQAIALVRPQKGINVDFLKAFYQSSIGQNIIEQTKRPVARANINLDEISEMPFPVIDSQKELEIVVIINNAYQSKALKLQQAQELVDDIDTFIYNSLDLKEPVQKENSINNRVFKVHLAPAFTDRLDPHFYNPEFEENDDLIRTLNHKKLKDIISFSNESWNQKDYFTETFPYIEISEINLLTGEINNVVETPIDNAASRAKMIVRENDIIVSTTRPHRGAITKITKENDLSIASTGFAVLRDIKLKDLDRDYLLYILRSELVKKQLLQRSSGGNYPAITQGELKKVIIPIPDIKIQKQIVEEVEKRILTHKRLLKEAETEFQQAKQQVEQIILGK